MKLSLDDRRYLKHLKNDEFEFVLDFYKDSNKLEWIQVVLGECSKNIESLVSEKRGGNLELLDLWSRLDNLRRKWQTPGGRSVIEEFSDSWTNGISNILDRAYPAWRTTD